ncbi:OmpA family protein [Desulfonema magnum]|uniref:OmpA-like domain-containing protein n=1 Tax=Desulfonema magnum TaxID=45655 RepID=A0A975BFM0_9BACT|nr:OmpA family protein [Desulfonema magnum]QTA84541.1 OmpA-like domain-containing protein [Desulfonema magnum]
MKKWLKVLGYVMISTMLLVGFASQNGLAMFKPDCSVPELTADAVKAGKVTANYARVKNGKIVFGKSPTAYSPNTLNRILNGYGLALLSEAVPQVQKASKSFVRIRNGKAVFGTKATAYSPDVLNTILEGYGITFPLESAKGMTDPPSYAKVEGGKIIFGTKATAYSPEEFNMLLSAYCLPEEEEVPPEPVEVEPEVITPKEEPPVVEEVKPIPTPCPDADNDGVCDQDDDCPDTPKAAFVNERGCWVIENLLFDYDKSEIRPQYYPDLDNVVKVLKENPYLNIEIQGHTCNIGSKRYNKPLSERRAKAVYNYFVQRGIDSGRLSTIGYWFSIPAASNDTEEGRAQNRRVELHPIR